MNISIIVPFHSNELLFYMCLASLKRTVPQGVEIILVLNNEDQSQLPRVRASKNIRPIYVEENLGYSRAINLGASEARGNYLVFCDSDTFVLPGWLEAHARHHQKFRRTGITSGKIISSRTGRLLDFGIGRTFYNHFHPFRHASAESEWATRDHRVQMACSANMMISKETFFEVGMLDEKLVYFYQDVDLSLRLKDIGRECWVIAGAEVFHKGAFASRSRPAVQVDERGYYTAKNVTRLEADFDHYLDLSVSAFRRAQKFAQEYHLVNLATVHQSTILETLSAHLRFAGRTSFNLSKRDTEAICLLESLDAPLLRSRSPLIFFVDTLLSLRHNALWATCRQGRYDLAVDRHANVCLFDDLVAGRF